MTLSRGRQSERVAGCEKSVDVLAWVKWLRHLMCGVFLFFEALLKGLLHLLLRLWVPVSGAFEMLGDPSLKGKVDRAFSDLAESLSFDPRWSLGSKTVALVSSGWAVWQELACWKQQRPQLRMGVLPSSSLWGECFPWMILP